MAVQDYKINYKSDFVLTINGDAGWAVPFCIKFWTGMPSQAYFVGFDGVKYVNCRVGDTPTQLLVMFDDHHLPIGPLRMQIAYHTTIEEFPGSVFDEVTNASDVIVTIDGTDYQVLLDFTGEDAPELEFDLPAYANEAERIQNELQRQQNEAARIEAELQREQATAAAVQGAENVNAQLNGTTLTVTNRNGVSTSVNTKGEQGERGPVGPEGPQGEQGETGISIVSFTPKSETSTTLIYTATFSDGHTQDVAIPKGPKGDTGATGPQGQKGDTGVSITAFTYASETETDMIYTVTFSDDTTEEVAVPKGPQGDTGLTGNGIASITLNSDYTLTIAYTDGTTYTTPSIRGAQGVQGVSIIAFTQTGETATNTLYNVVFSDGRTQSVAIPKGVKGDKGDTGNPGSQGAQGPKGDTVTATDYTLYNVQGSDSQGAMSQDATTKAISAQTGYYTCGTPEGTPEKVVTVESGNLYKRTLGGHFKVKMTNKNTAASGVTLKIGSETAPLYYNGETVSASNSWEEGEVISVYFDGTNYQASNAQGGGGKLKINDTENADVEFVDDYGNALVRFSDGHVQTKNFDSREIKTIVDNTESADFNVADEDGNVVLSVGDGHIKTKNFDSSNIKLDKYAKKKTIKYLAIGNSVNQDPACYIPYLLRKLYGDDIDFEIGVPYHGSYTIKDYVELMITGQDNLRYFSYAKNTGHLTNITNVPLSYAVGYTDWDIVSFEAYQTDMAGSGRTEDVTLAPELLDWLKQHTKDGCRFGLITPATYTDVRDLYVGWQQDILTSCSLDFLLDYGATKEFLIAKGFVNSDLSPLEDGRYIHSKEGFPCEALALTAIHFLADIVKIDDRASNLLSQITEIEHSALNVPQQNGTYTSTTEDGWRKCVDAALDGWRVSLASYAISNNTLRDNTFTNI